MWQETRAEGFAKIDAKYPSIVEVDACGHRRLYGCAECCCTRLGD
jgi:hypothetical protein